MSSLLSLLSSHASSGELNPTVTEVMLFEIFEVGSSWFPRLCQREPTQPRRNPTGTSSIRTSSPAPNQFPGPPRDCRFIRDFDNHFSPPVLDASDFSLVVNPNEETVDTSTLSFYPLRLQHSNKPTSSPPQPSSVNTDDLKQKFPLVPIDSYQLSSLESTPPPSTATKERPLGSDGCVKSCLPRHCSCFCS